MEKMKLILEGTVPSLKNSKQILRKASGRPFISSSTKAKQWTKNAVEELKTQFNGYIIVDYPITVELVMYNKDNIRRDLDNQASTVLDALRHANVIEDDDFKHINHLIVRYGGTDKNNPRCEIILQDKA